MINIFLGINKKDIESIAKKTDFESQKIFEFLTICRHDLKLRFAATIFEISRSKLSRRFNDTLDVLSNKWATNHLGASVFSKQSIINKHTPENMYVNIFIFYQLLDIFSRLNHHLYLYYIYQRKKIFPNVRGILDGTYIYVQKSTEFQTQKLSYSGQKKRNLFKFMFLILPDGKIWNYFGPMGGNGTHNDAWMLQYIISEDLGKFATTFYPGT